MQYPVEVPGVSMISIHALHEESDHRVTDISAHVVYISIHALHEESDRKTHTPDNGYNHFNPRSP